RVAEVRVLEVDPHFEPGGADAVVVGVVHVEHQIERAAREADPRDVDLLQLEVGLGERQVAQGGAGGQEHNGDGKTDGRKGDEEPRTGAEARKSTRLNSS